MTDMKPDPATEKNKAPEKDAMLEDGLADYGSAGQAAVEGVDADKAKTPEGE